MGGSEQVRETRDQAGLSRAARITNLKGAFRVVSSDRIECRKVLLVDDVITTTATVREAASTLIEAGASQVEVIALARAAGPSLPPKLQTATIR